MDKDVLTAMARWPDVPDAYGWLSLSQHGQWRLQPGGDAQVPGDPIENEQILNFINRNYSSDSAGRWFFQNGPQRVFVQLEAAPFILHTTSAAAVSNHPSATMANTGKRVTLRTHNGLDVSTVDSWWLDDTGRLYIQTEHGPGLLTGRDLAEVLDALVTDDGVPLEIALGPLLEQPPATRDPALSHRAALRVRLAGPQGSTTPPDQQSIAPLYLCAADHIPEHLGFVLKPSVPVDQPAPNQRLTDIQ